jgi:hypothetical protein
LPGRPPTDVPARLPLQLKDRLLEAAAGLRVLGRGQQEQGQGPDSPADDTMATSIAAIASLSVLAGCNGQLVARAAAKTPPATASLLSWQELQSSGLPHLVLQMPFRHAKGHVLAGAVRTHVSRSSPGALPGARRSGRSVRRLIAGPRPRCRRACL